LSKLDETYTAFEAVEEAFHQALDEPLDAQGLDVLYDLVAAMHLPRGARAIDVGCDDGAEARELESRFGFDVVGVDPLAEPPYVVGFIEDLPFPDESFDLVWCRDMLSHIADLPRAFSELRRVLRPSGRAMVYLMLATNRLEPREASELFGLLGVVGDAFVAGNVEAAMAGFRVDQVVEIGSQWGEVDDGRKPGRRLLWAARLRRDPERYIERFGQSNYDVMLGDCLWHVYAMLGKLSRRAYVLTKA